MDKNKTPSGRGDPHTKVLEIFPLVGRQKRGPRCEAGVRVHLAAKGGDLQQWTVLEKVEEDAGIPPNKISGGVVCEAERGEKGDGEPRMTRDVKEGRYVSFPGGNLSKLIISKTSSSGIG